MANLSVTDRSRIWRGLMRRWSKDSQTCSFIKTQLYDPTTNTGAISDVDTWIDTHQGNTTTDNIGMNGSISVSMRNALTAEQKTDILIAVAAMRRGLEYIKSIFGEVD